MSPRQHVLFIVNNYPPHLGGVQLHVQNLASGLVRRGVSASVFTLSEQPAEPANEDGVLVHRLARRFTVGEVISFPRFGASKRIESWARMNDVTAVSVHTRFFPMSLVGVRIAKRLRVPSIHTEHGSDFVRSGSRAIDLASRGYDLTIGRTVLRNADTVLAVSDGAAQFVKRLSNRGSSVFHNAIDVGAFAAARRDSRPHSLVFVGRLVRGKGWYEALQAYRALAASQSGVSIDFVGDGPDFDNLTSAAAGDPGVRIHGRVEPSEIPAILAGATLVNPTTLSEGFQTTLLESLAAGGRVVTYDVPGARELMKLGDNVRVVNSDQLSLQTAIAELTRADIEPMPIQALGPWDWAHQAERYADLLTQVNPTTT